MRVTENNIVTSPDGYFFLECDGRHSPPWHRYLYYTKKEVIDLWAADHDTKKGNKMQITLPIKSNNDYSSWVYGPAAFLAYKVVPAISTLLAQSVREKLHQKLADKEQTILVIRRAIGVYPDRTWFGLNGVDQYDLWADCCNLVGKRL